MERWFAQHGRPPLLDLARSGAPALTVRDLLQWAPPDALAELLGLRLDYGDGSGSVVLRDAIAASGAARCGGEVLVTHGGVEALLLTCAAVIGRRRRVLVGTPAYEALLRTPFALGASVEAVAVWQPGHDALDLGSLCRRVDEGVAAVLVNSPANPTGAVALPADLDALAARCGEVGAMLVVDEVAVGTLDGCAQSACSLSAFECGGVVVIGDVSKACGLGGLRVGWLTTASAPLLAAATALKDLTSVGNASPSELLAAWALLRREEVVATVRGAARANVTVLAEFVAALRDAWLTVPRDGLVAFPFLPRAATIEFADRLRHLHGVSLVPGGMFGVDGHVRFGLGLQPPLFAEALERLDAALRSPAG